MPKLDWFALVDRALDKADRAFDRVRKTPRRRLDVVPEPRDLRDPFSAPKPAASAAPKPLGDAGLAAQLYGRRTCDRSGRARQLLETRSIVARFVDLDDPDHRALEARLVTETKRYDTPYVYLRGRYVGGHDELVALDRAGDLEARVEPAR